MTRLILALAICLACLTSFAADSRRVGSGHSLEGEIALYEIWVDREDDPWDEASVRQVTTNANLGMQFVVDQAKLYGKDVHFRVASMRVPWKGRVPAAATENTVKWTELICSRAFNASANSALTASQKRYDLNSDIILIYVKQKGRSFASPYVAGQDDWRWGERCVVYYKRESGEITPPGTYAHEILHLFGANDLYFPEDRDDHRVKMAARYYPYDIMRVTENLQQLEVGKFSAYRVGWVSQRPHGEAVFEPKEGSRIYTYGNEYDVRIRKQKQSRATGTGGVLNQRE